MKVYVSLSKAFSILTLLFCSLGYAQNQITLCIPEAPPYSGKELADGGPLTDMVTEVFQRSGMNVVTVFPPWARLMQMGKQGKCLIVGLWRNAERDKLFSYSDKPVLYQKLALYIRRGNELKNLYPGVLAKERLSYVPLILQKQKWQMHDVVSVSQGLKMLIQSRADVLYGETGHIDFLISKSPEHFGKIDKVYPLLEVKGGYVAGAKSYKGIDKILESFDKEFSQYILLNQKLFFLNK